MSVYYTEQTDDQKWGRPENKATLIHYMYLHVVMSILQAYVA